MNFYVGSATAYISPRLRKIPGSAAVCTWRTPRQSRPSVRPLATMAPGDQRGGGGGSTSPSLSALIPLGFVRPASAVNTQDECCTTAWASRPSFFASPMTPCLRSGKSCATVADFGSLVSLLLVGAMYGGANARVASQFNGC